MKKKLKDTKFGKILGSVAKGVALDPFKPIIGAVTGLTAGVKQISSDNKNSETGGQGKNDYLRWASFAAIVVLGFLLLTGKIDKSTFNFLLEAVQESV